MPTNRIPRIFDIFAGPKEPALLDAYGLKDNRTFGWFAPFSKTALLAAEILLHNHRAIQFWFGHHYAYGTRPKHDDPNLTQRPPLMHR